jgi:F-box domain
MLPLTLLREVIIYLPLTTIHRIARVNKFCAKALTNDRLWYRKYHMDFDQKYFGDWVSAQNIQICYRQLYFTHFYLQYTQSLEETKEGMVYDLINEYADQALRSETAIDGEVIHLHYSSISAPLDVYRVNASGEESKEIIILPTRASITLHYKFVTGGLIYYALIIEMMDELDDMFHDMFPEDIPVLCQVADVSLDMIPHYINYFRENDLVPQPYHVTIPSPLIIPELLREEEISLMEEDEQ